MDYFNHPALSCSDLKLIRRSFYQFLNKKSLKTKALTFGSAFHKAVLERDDFSSEFKIMPNFDKRTKLGKEKYEEFISAFSDFKLLSFSEARILAKLKKLIHSHSVFKAVFNSDDKIIEKPFFSTLEGVEVKCKPDIFAPSLGIAIDVKTTEDASKNGFLKSVIKHSYYLQASLYTYILNQNGFNIKNFLFVVVSKSDFMVGCYELDELETGLSEARKIINDYKEYKKLRFNNPFYKDTSNSLVQTISLPNYLKQEFI